jgi:predicted Rossmann fold nucleotide-binding protein DprA/Smf involved in DNA uptake
LGVSGHQALPAAAVRPVIAGLREAVAEAGTEPIGVTSLAAGSDQLFATEILAAGGQLHAVLPCQGYEHMLEEADRAPYRRLLEQARVVETLLFEKPSEAAFYAAGRRVVELSERLLAVWDGQPARGLGGTADVVAYARQQGREVWVIWPAGVSR